MMSSALTAADVRLDLEERTLHLAVEETFEEIGRRWMPWAVNGHAIRLDAAWELAESPKVAIIEHESGARLLAVVHVL
ncbi:hypothetical protein JB92DRAFT_3074552 [Gautieria morchelliformis]|nr:hypothetical protein JB92DRAFT_3074552 [Gautieria morchelliformis]